MKKMNNGNNGIFGLIGTVFLYMISRFTINEWASIATIFAATATGVYYIFKIINERKNKKS